MQKFSSGFNIAINWVHFHPFCDAFCLFAVIFLCQEKISTSGCLVSGLGYFEGLTIAENSKLAGNLSMCLLSTSEDAFIN